MSERKGPPSSEDRRKFNEPWRYSRYGSSDGTSSGSANNDTYNNNTSGANNNNNNNNNSNNNIHSSRRFGEQRSSSYGKSRSLSGSSYNGNYSRYQGYDSKYQSGYGYNKRYNNGPYRSSSSSSINTTETPAGQEHFHRSNSSSGVPTANSQAPFQRYRSSLDDSVKSTSPPIAKGKRSGDLINSRVPSYSSSGYDSREPYRSNRFYGYNSNREHSGYDSRYRGYQRKSSIEHKRRAPWLEEDDLIYGSIKPKTDKLKESSSASPNNEEHTSQEVSKVKEEHKEEDIHAIESKDDTEIKETKAVATVASVELSPLEEDKILELPKIDEKVEQEIPNEVPTIEKEVETNVPEDLMDVDKPVEEEEEIKTEVKLEEPERTSSVSSDQYDPLKLPLSLEVTIDTQEKVEEPEVTELKISVIEEPIKLKPSLISSMRDDIDEDEEMVKMSNELSENYLPKSVEGDIFPLNRIEAKVWDLKSNSKHVVRSQLPYLRESPLTDFNRYLFFQTNILIHEQAIKPKLLHQLSHIKKYVHLKGKKLCVEFYDRNISWQKRVKFMEEQLNAIHNSEDSTESVSHLDESLDSKTTQDDFLPPNSSSSRRVRNTGIVNSEAEFAEILQRMKEEEENDPLFRARKAAAVIPDMILDPVTRDAFKFISTNNLITDLKEWHSRLVSDKIDNFSKLEHELFCEAYASFPKRFGKISSIMESRRSPEECVLHYYRTKRHTNYKQLVAAKNKRLGRKSGSARSKGKQVNKSRTGTQNNNTPTVSTPVSSTLDNTDGDLSVSDSRSDDTKKLELETHESEVTEDDSSKRKRDVVEPTSVTLDAVNKKLNDDLERPKLKKQRSSKKKVKVVDDLKMEDEVVENENQDDAAHQLELLKSYATLAQVVPENHSTSMDRSQQESSMDSEIDQQQSIVKSDHSQDVDSPPNSLLKISKKDKKPPHITSYWSINDANKFPSILAECGTQWHLIARKIQTKTTTMVRNYYSKNANAVNNWAAIAREADLKRNGTTNGGDPLQMRMIQQYQPMQPQLEIFPAYQSQSQQQSQQPPPPPSQQPMKLPSLRDITNGMSEMSNLPTPSHFQPPPTFGASRDQNERRYANVLNPSSETESHPQQLPPPSRTSIMSLLNSEPTQQLPPQSKPNLLGNLLNPTASTYSQPPPQPTQQPQQQLPLPSGGLFSLAALAEVATEVNKTGFTTKDEK